MTIQYQCPVCDQALHQHEASKGFYCDNKHHFDRHANGYWVFALPKKQKPNADSRQLMRAKRHLLESGIFTPLIDTMASQLALALSKMSSVEHLDMDCGDGFYLRALAQACTQGDTPFVLSQTGISEAENAVFAAAKAQDGASYLLGGSKKLPFADESFDLVSLIDKPLKGKECVRVLKSGGCLLQVSPAPRHLWQIREHIYADLTEKPFQLSFPPQLALLHSERVSFDIDVSGEQALTLLEMTPYAWRVNDKLKRKLLNQEFSRLEVDFMVNLALKK